MCKKCPTGASLGIWDRCLPPLLVGTIHSRSCYPTGSASAFPALGKTCSKMQLWDKSISMDRQTDLWRQLLSGRKSLYISNKDQAMNRLVQLVQGEE